MEHEDTAAPATATATATAEPEPTAPTAESAQRAALLEAAARIVADGGVAALSTRRLAEQVGISTMGVYTWFGSKANLLRALYREAFLRFAEELDATPVTERPLHDLMALGSAYRRHALANPHLYEIMFGHSSARFEPEPEDLALAFGTFARLVDGVRRCVDAGALGGDPEEGARQLWAGVHGAVSLELVGQQHFDPDPSGSYAGLMRTLTLGLGAAPADLSGLGDGGEVGGIGDGGKGGHSPTAGRPE